MCSTNPDSWDFKVKDQRDAALLSLAAGGLNALVLFFALFLSFHLLEKFESKQCYATGSESSEVAHHETH